MKINGKIFLIALLAGMVAVSGCNKKARKAEAADKGKAAYKAHADAVAAKKAADAPADEIQL